jgi:membrane protease YdiL (CAAX protease family)
MAGTQAAGEGSERLPGLAWPPLIATGLYYSLPTSLQGLPAVQFLPQLLAYLGFGGWAFRNGGVPRRLGLEGHRLGQGLRWGTVTGLLLGGVNVSVILWLVPLLGGDISFLRETPHARVPAAIMLPWGILLIAMAVELNFRGFLLGRLWALSARAGAGSVVAPTVAIAGSALAFAFDPFMVATFKHLHWIAVWDGLVWGLLWVRLNNLYAPIAAHAVEVMILYSILKHTLGN